MVNAMPAAVDMKHLSGRAGRSVTQGESMALAKLKAKRAVQQSREEYPSMTQSTAESKTQAASKGDLSQRLEELRCEIKDGKNHVSLVRIRAIHSSKASLVHSDTKQKFFLLDGKVKVLQREELDVEGAMSALESQRSLLEVTEAGTLEPEAEEKRNDSAGRCINVPVRNVLHESGCESEQIEIPKAASTKTEAQPYLPIPIAPRAMLARREITTQQVMATRAQPGSKPNLGKGGEKALRQLTMLKSNAAADK